MIKNRKHTFRNRTKLERYNFCATLAEIYMHTHFFVVSVTIFRCNMKKTDAFSVFASINFEPCLTPLSTGVPGENHNWLYKSLPKISNIAISKLSVKGNQKKTHAQKKIFSVLDIWQQNSIGHEVACNLLVG